MSDPAYYEVRKPCLRFQGGSMAAALQRVPHPKRLAQQESRRWSTKFRQEGIPDGAKPIACGHSQGRRDLNIAPIQSVSGHRALNSPQQSCAKGSASW